MEEHLQCSEDHVAEKMQKYGSCATEIEQVLVEREFLMVSGDDTTETESLLRAAEQGDRAALSRLVDMHRAYLRRVIDLRMDQALRGRVDRSDIVQETQMVANRRIKDYIQRCPTSFKLWLRGEAMQQVASHHRRHVTADRRSVQRECSISGRVRNVTRQGTFGGYTQSRRRGNKLPSGSAIW